MSFRGSAAWTCWRQIYTWDGKSIMDLAAVSLTPVKATLQVVGKLKFPKEKKGIIIIISF